jgi:Sigma 54 modulation/S30EA ribosomal protein C terminus
VDHDFYIYLDADSGHVQVVYKRKGGAGSGHGLIITIPDDASLTAA